MVHIYFDAATNQQTGDNGLGVWVKMSNGNVVTFTERRTGLSSVQAELAALVFALKQAEALKNESTFLFYSDAETIVRALEQRFMRDKSVKSLFLEALITYDELPVTFIKWIPRAENRADAVAKAALLGE